MALAVKYGSKFRPQMQKYQWYRGQLFAAAAAAADGGGGGVRRVHDDDDDDGDGVGGDNKQCMGAAD